MATFSCNSSLLEGLHPSSDLSDEARCSAAKECIGLEEPTNHASKIPYLVWHFCEAVPAKLGWLSIAGQIFWLAFLLYALVSTAQRYFFPAVAKATERLGLAPHVAAVTLLAFGNGSPDLFAASVAVSHGFPALALSSILGSAVFVTSAVLGVVVIVANDAGLSSRADHRTGRGFRALLGRSLSAVTAHGTSAPAVPRRPFIRDVLFLAIVVGVLAACLINERLEIWESLLFIGLYVLYVFASFVGRFIFQSRKRRRRESLGIVEDASDFQQLLDMETDDGAIFDGSEDEDDPYLVVRRSRVMAGIPQSGGFGGVGSVFLPSRRGVGTPSRGSMAGAFRLCAQNLSISTGWQERSFASKVTYVLLAPTHLVRNLTVPLVGDGQWSRTFTTLNAVGLPALIMFAIQTDFWNLVLPMGSFNLPVVVPLGFVSCLGAAVVYLATENENPPRPTWAVAILIVAALAGSACWMYLISTEMVFVLLTMGLEFNINPVILGLTVVAWGNSSVDMVANVLVARQGFVGMSVAACFAAPSFNLLFGVGISVLIEQVRVLAGDSSASPAVDSDTKGLVIPIDTHLKVAFVFLGISILSSFVAFPLAKFSTPRFLGPFLVFVYVIFCVLAVLAETGVF